VRILDNMADALLQRDNFELRSLVQDLVRSNVTLSNLPMPTNADPRHLAAAASLVELLALRWGQLPPTWVSEAQPLVTPLFVVPSADTMRNLRALCENESPEPLRKRGFYAPPNFLEFA